MLRIGKQGKAIHIADFPCFNPRLRCAPGLCPQNSCLHKEPLSGIISYSNKLTANYKVAFGTEILFK